MVAVKLRPFFSIYGGKWRVSKYYPKPKFQTLIEPFAGGGGYSLNFPHLNVVLYERDERIAGIWRYLIEEASPEEILSIPDIAPDGSIDDLRGYPKVISRQSGCVLGYAQVVFGVAELKKRLQHNSQRLGIGRFTTKVLNNVNFLGKPLGLLTLPIKMRGSTIVTGQR